MGELPSTLPGSRGQDAPMDPSMPTPCPLLLNQATRCLAVDFQHTLLAGRSPCSGCPLPLEILHMASTERLPPADPQCMGLPRRKAQSHCA